MSDPNVIVVTHSCFTGNQICRPFNFHRTFQSIIRNDNPPATPLGAVGVLRLRYALLDNMVDTEEGEGNSTRKNDWEVVSLSASSYSTAAPNSDDAELKNPIDVEEGNVVSNQHGAQTLLDLFLSGHFVFPLSQHEDLPLEPENTEIPEEHSDKNDIEFDLEGARLIRKADKDHTFGVVHDDFDELNAEEEKQSHHGASASLSSSAVGRSTEGGLESEDNSDLPTESLRVIKDDDTCEPQLPCEAWWKKRATSLYVHAKEANALWSICLAAAVMGLVVLGQRWQQERWQVLQSKWQLSMKNENMGMILGPIYRMKDAILGGRGSGSFIRGVSSCDT